MLEVVLLRFDDAQLQRILLAVSAAAESGRVERMVEQLYHLVRVGNETINKELISMSASLHDQVQAVIAEAHHNSDVAAATLKALNDFIAIVDASKGDAVALEAALNEFKANDQALADAVANVNPTPAPTP